MSTAIALRAEDFTREQVDLIKRTICVGATDDELSLFVQQAQRMRLDPFSRQIFAVKRWNKNAGREVMSTQVSIDGFRLTAERTGKYAGQLGPFWTNDGQEWVEVWLSRDPPKAAKVGVLRHDFKEPVWAVATWEEYKQEGRNGLSPMWAKMSALMLAKCAESLGLRRAFPNELSGVYSPEEMAQAAVGEPEYTPPAPKEDARPKAGAPGAGTSPATNAGAPTTKETTATGGRAPRANTVKHDGTFANHKQVALLHILKSRIGGMTEKCDCWDANGQRINPTRKMCLYHTQLAAFKDCDNRPIRTSKDLSEDQISNLISRYEAKIKQQDGRAAEPLDLGALGGVKPDEYAQGIHSRDEDDPFVEVHGAIDTKDDPEACLTELCEIFRCPTVDDIPKHEAPHALALVLAYGTPKYPEVLARVRP